MKYSVEVETDSHVYQSPGYSGYGTPVTRYGTPTTTGRGTPSRQLTWAIEVDISKILTTPTAVRRTSRMEKEDELIQQAMRKKSRKVKHKTPRLMMISMIRFLDKETGWYSRRRLES